ncbi:MAG: T9SS type A sorting domain-containing protein [Bacteroidota bacterium]|nr:T9SS type A sorting domain-containing protein [Bacteroidota bacterium]
MITALAAGLSLVAQQSATVLKVPVHKGEQYQAPTDIQFSQVYPQSNTSNARAGQPAPAPLLTTEAVIGSTKYNLQTNSSMPHRIWYNSDGTISSIFTFADGTWLSWPDRGTGYNYFDGTTWLPNATARIESGRTGFPDMVVLNNGFEMTVAHNTASSVMHFCSRPVKGFGPWTENAGTLIPNPPNFAFFCLWPRMAVGGASGDVIHHIAITEPVGNNGAIYRGQDGCMMYSRSNDGGATFAVQNQLLSPFDSTQSASMNGDAYAIDAMNNTVAIVIGGFGEDVVLAKSIDGGVTWTKTIVQDFPFTPWTDVMTDTLPTDGIVDTLETNDASLSVLIDNAGQVHVWYGQMFIYNDGTGTFYLAGTSAMMYWNEGMTGPPVAIVDGNDLDLDQSGVIDVADWGTYQVGLISHPSTGIDASGNLFCAYTAVVENSDDGTGKSYRNIYVIESMDDGATWTGPYNISPDAAMEKVYPSMARKVTSSCHIAYLRDQIPGHGVFATGTTDADNMDQVHEWVYANVPVDDIVAGVNETPANVSAVEVYPNPANTSANVKIKLANAQEVTVSVYNTTGQLVSSQVKNLSAGISMIALDVANLPSGIYFINVTEGTSTISKKLIVE